MIGIFIFLLRALIFIGMFFMVEWWCVILISSSYFVIKYLFFRFSLGVEMQDAMSATYYLNCSGNTSQIVGTCILEQCNIDTVVRTFSKLVSLPGTLHFRKRVINILGNCYFLNERKFSVRKHVRILSRGSLVKDIDQLVELMGVEMMTPIPPELSPWEVAFVPHFMDKSAFFWKVNHTLGDGVALQYLFSHSGDDPPEIMQRFGGRRWVLELLWLLYPFMVIAGLIFLNIRKKDRTPFTQYKGNALTGMRLTSYAGPYKLPHIKELARRFGTTINNLLLANVLSTLKEYFLQEHQIEISKMNIGIPVSYRVSPTTRPLFFDNKFVLFVQNYPLAPAPISRGEFQGILNVSKSILNPLITRMLVFSNYMNSMLPHIIGKFNCNEYNNNTGVIFTNIAGSRRHIYFNGHLVYDILYLAPSLGKSGTNISIASYGDRISILTNSDISRLRNPQLFTQIFSEHMERYFGDYEGGVQYASPDLRQYIENLGYTEVDELITYI